MLTAMDVSMGRTVGTPPHVADSHDRIRVKGAPADLVASRATLTGEHLAAYVGG
jgi:hypothetical protein